MRNSRKRFLNLLLIITLLVLGFLGTINSSQADDNISSFLSPVMPTASQAVLTQPQDLLKFHHKKALTISNWFNSSDLLRGTTPTAGTEVASANSNPDFTLNTSGGFDSNNNPYVSLNWKDMSNTANGSYSGGYQVTRTTDDPSNSFVNWEPVGTNYGKKIKILNVYPTAGNHLKDWMNIIPNGQIATVSNDLIAVTPVAETDFNANPNHYLFKDANGKYNYDGLFFGSADGGKNVDLSVASANATSAFGDTGRSLIFGHDTLTGNLSHYNSFADKLGLKIMPMSYDSGPNDDRIGSKTVELMPDMRTGSLASYPNKLLQYNSTNKFTIQPSHTGGQFYLYSGGAQRWMDFAKDSGQNSFHFLGSNTKPTTSVHYLDSNGNRTSNPNGAIGDDNWYLITKNNYAMTQTGHTTGACSVEEAMILANMMYYTSTLNTTTHGEDRTVKDTAAPDAPIIDNITPTDSDTVTANCKSTDNATNYYYQVQAKRGSNSTNSQCIKQPIKSDIKGYIYQIDNNANTTINPNKDTQGNIDSSNNTNFISVSDPTSKASINNINRFSNKYLHVVAIDNANNVSTTSSKKISDLINKSQSYYIYQIWDDDNHDGLKESTEKIIQHQTISFFYRKQDGTYEPILTKINSCGNESYSGGWLQLNSTVQAGIDIDTAAFKGLTPTITGGDSCLQTSPPKTINGQRYVLSDPLKITDTIPKIEMGLTQQLHFLSLANLPKMDFGNNNNIIGYQNTKTLTNNNSTDVDNELQIDDQRGSQPILNYSAIPYDVTIKLSPFKNGNKTGLQQVQLIFQERNNPQLVTVTPDGAEVPLYTSGTAIVNGINTRYYNDTGGHSQIKLKVPPKNLNNDITAGTYSATLTYAIKNAP